MRRRVLQRKANRSRSFGWMAYAPIAASALFAILYGLLRPAYDEFYDAFGLTPDQLGLNEATIIGHTAGFAASIVVVLGAGALFAWGGYRLMASLLSALLGWKAPFAAIDRLLLWLQGQAVTHRARTVVGYITASILLITSMTVVYLYDLRALSSLAKPNELHGNAQIAVGLSAELFVLGSLISIMITVLSLPPRLVEPAKRALQTLAVASSAVILVVSATEVVDFWSTSYKVGRNLIGARDTQKGLNVFLWLGVIYSPARIYPLTNADPLAICDGKKVPYLLGENSGFDFVVVYPTDEVNHPGSVMRVPQSLYAVASGLDSPAPCSMRK